MSTNEDVTPVELRAPKMEATQNKEGAFVVFSEEMGDEAWVSSRAVMEVRE